MKWFKGRDRLDQVFLVGIALKGLDGALEVLGGVLLLIVTPEAINQVARFFTQHELSEDSHDFVANHILHAAGTLTQSTVRFGAIYLASHGIAKVVLVAALLRNKLWAYPWMIALLLAFAGYQIYRIALAFSVGLTALTVFDLAVAWLTYREYVKQRAHPRAPLTTAR